MKPVLAGLAVVASVVAVMASAGDAGGRPALGGVWRLDASRSEDAREKMRAQREKEQPRDGMRGGGFGGGGGGRGGWGGRGGGMGGPGGARGRRGDGTSFEALREAMDAILEAPEAMALTVGENEVEIAAKGGSVRRFRPDGRKVKHENPPSESLARWEGQTLINETWLGSGAMHIVEVWALGQPSRDLEVRLRIEGRRFGGEPITAKRVYVPDVPASPAPSSGSGAP
jgi:hypothetical protein